MKINKKIKQAYFKTCGKCLPEMHAGNADCMKSFKKVASVLTNVMDEYFTNWQRGSIFFYYRH